MCSYNQGEGHISVTSGARDNSYEIHKHPESREGDLIFVNTLESFSNILESPASSLWWSLIRVPTYTGLRLLILCFLVVSFCRHPHFSVNQLAAVSIRSVSYGNLGAELRTAKLLFHIHGCQKRCRTLLIQLGCTENSSDLNSRMQDDISAYNTVCVCVCVGGEGGLTFLFDGSVWGENKVYLTTVTMQPPSQS